MAVGRDHGTDFEIRDRKNSDEHGFIFETDLDGGVVAVVDAAGARGETECAVAAGG